mmetsp:Transcript_9932/g.11617  ORF Transcript_9932/g.11617 Transcript_9932/m.11617 type:complete len:353 (+) Transcript_9932:144-1202(+)|eukprot:CAMPEP_0198250574 /NCGR_PEP_ID=MMETSP1447-20131203/1708_1 /TAXON_ID=420782 /ORGANISM="Chaetoceros dichaeta, Strain CCMP1751" /LENGTH=352 /DNA_ID=CAMNT_0043935421 /DNA_START=141 /DNA_END=1199 /DNA_ORIENTATION=+
MDDAPPYALDVHPDDALQFTLTRSGNNADSKSDGASRCTMTLRHTGKTDSHIAFKVKTTQPRRYLVRPNQGIVSPGKTESVTILLVEKDKQVLLQSFDRLGQSALDHSKDKFLVQSCIVLEQFANDYILEKSKITEVGAAVESSKVGKGLTEALTGMWNSAGSNATADIFNKKLQVRHVVAPDGRSADERIVNQGADGATSKPNKRPVPPSDGSNLEKMTPEQMFAEISSLRRKYDELVSFSVNLTAERDILNNTLEQTKRELNREMGARASLENNRAGDGTGGAATVKVEKSGLGPFTFLFISVLFFLIGVKATNSDAVDFLFNIPVFGNLLSNGYIETETDTEIDSATEL